MDAPATTVYALSVLVWEYEYLTWFKLLNFIHKLLGHMHILNVFILLKVT